MALKTTSRTTITTKKPIQSQAFQLRRRRRPPSPVNQNANAADGRAGDHHHELVPHERRGEADEGGARRSASARRNERAREQVEAERRPEIRERLLEQQRRVHERGDHRRARGREDRPALRDEHAREQVRGEDDRRHRRDADRLRRRRTRASCRGSTTRARSGRRRASSNECGTPRRASCPVIATARESCVRSNSSVTSHGARFPQASQP